MVWTFATVEMTDKLLFVMFASMGRCLELSDASVLANMAWALAVAALYDELLFATMPRVAEQHLSEFNMQNLSNTVWAFATADVVDWGMKDCG